MLKVRHSFVVAVLVSLNASAIEFITEEQVAQRLGAQKVIEVSKYSVETLITPGSECDSAFPSKSARAYVVKRGQKAALYLTVSGLNELSRCRDL